MISLLLLRVCTCFDLDLRGKRSWIYEVLARMNRANWFAVRTLHWDIVGHACFSQTSYHIMNSWSFPAHTLPPVHLLEQVLLEPLMGLGILWTYKPWSLHTSIPSASFGLLCSVRITIFLSQLDRSVHSQNGRIHSNSRITMYGTLLNVFCCVQP